MISFFHQLICLFSVLAILATWSVNSYIMFTFPCQKNKTKQVYMFHLDKSWDTKARKQIRLCFVFLFGNNLSVEVLNKICWDINPLRNDSWKIFRYGNALRRRQSAADLLSVFKGLSHEICMTSMHFVKNEFGMSWKSWRTAPGERFIWSVNPVQR